VIELLWIVPVVLLSQVLPVLVAVGPPIAMAVRRRWSLPGLALWLFALGLLVAWGAAASAGIDRADATGGQGSIWTGAHWLLAAVAVAAAAVRTVLRRGRPEALGG
jgi:hypothetical protein